MLGGDMHSHERLLVITVVVVAAAVAVAAAVVVIRTMKICIVLSEHCIV